MIVGLHHVFQAESSSKSYPRAKYVIAHFFKTTYCCKYTYCGTTAHSFIFTKYSISQYSIKLR